MATEHYEVVVIGGGPAGSAAAYTLGRAGRQVCLIDKAVFPRDKLCGGGLTFRAKRAFEATFGRRWRPDLINTSHDVSFHAGGRLIGAFRTRTPIDFMMRRAFDHYLVELAVAAGAVLKQGDSAHTLDLEKRTILLSSEQVISYDFLIGADGVNSMVAKALFGQSFDPARVAFALEAEVPRDRWPEQGDDVEFDFGAARWGYGWVFPKQETVTVGVGGWHRLNPDLRDKFDLYLRGKGLSSDEVHVKGQFLPGETRPVPGRDTVLLCGDAAGAVDPMSGEGIPFAIATGAAAGRAVAQALAQGGNALALYQAEFERIVAPFAQSRFWRWFVYPRLMQRLFVWAFGFESLRKRMLTERKPSASNKKA